MDVSIEDDDFSEIMSLPIDQIHFRTKMLDNEIKVMSSEYNRIRFDYQDMVTKTKEYRDRIRVNKTLPYLVSTVVEILNTELEDDELDDPDLVAAGSRKSVCVKTSTRHAYFLSRVGIVDPDLLKPGMFVGVHKDSNLIMELLPQEFDPRVKVMEIDERPQEDYVNIGGLDKQINELIEAIVLPVNHKEKFKKLGIQPPKGVLLYGPPGTGKTLMARACAAQTSATFLKLAAPQLVQMFIGDGAKMVRDAFALAKAKSPTIIFIDELDAIGMKRFNSDKAGDREVQRTMLELLNQLDGFSPIDDIKVIAATNRVDILDPALLRSGRIDLKIEFPNPNEEGRLKILQIHSRKMSVSKDVIYPELARSTEHFNGAMLRGVCIEAGMIAIRRGAMQIEHEDFVDAIVEVQAKKKTPYQYYA